MIETATKKGLHDFVGEQVLARFVRPGLRAAGLGSGPGAMAARLHQMGCDVIAADQNVNGSAPQLPHLKVNSDQTDFAAKLGERTFGSVTAIEVIEHVESPIGLLRNVRRLLLPGGVASITIPNVDSLPASLKFLVAGKMRTMAEHSEPPRISPMFFDLLQRQFPFLAGLRLHQNLLFLADGLQLSRRTVAWSMDLAASVFSGESNMGDDHIFVLEAAS